ncbi:helicase HerA-like domain-containing protein [Tessaracoccus caeni]|uniref:helicase HerA-like domain-containing protein n=1 Tax=Tessaracoccus caeni TaxID=3031239 RepID=UPI0023DADE34|nr:helicase HerA-like domain-containing protein [Tessaracoccus caeni]MDF1489198.1 DUF853 family protein [Tessaracoccus caeni]
MSEDLAALRLQLAEAEARAKAAEAEAARAQAEAAKAALELAASKAGGPASEATQVDVAQAEVAPHAQGQPTDTVEAPTEVVTQAAEAVEAKPEAPEPAVAPPVETPAEPAASQQLSPFLETVRAGYAFDAPSMTIGTVMDQGTPVPGVTARMPLSLFNRHMLVAGATGTGKTRTLQLLAEGLSAAGSSVLLCDVKGDLTGLAEAGASSEKLLARTGANGQAWAGASFPVELLTLSGSDDQRPGAAVRVPISDFGPILLARALDLNTTQEQCLQLIFAWADAENLELIDLADIRSVITFLTSDEGKEELAELGGVSKATAGVILRALTALEAQGGDQFFGSPGFDSEDLLRQVDGKGVISLLAVGDLMRRPALVSTMIMWLLADLFTALPEVGDPDRPKLVFFFDEAHLLFANATKEFVNQVIQTVRLIRSKGVGIVFVTQTPKDIPGDVLAQLGSKVQHALRATTPEDQKKLKQTVDTFPRTSLDLAEVLTTLGTGEAVVTVLGPDGRPTPVSSVKIWAPASVMGPAQTVTVHGLAGASALAAKYANAVNPLSAEEKLQQRADEAQAEKARLAAEAAAAVEAEKLAKQQAAEAEKERKRKEAEYERQIRELEKEEQRKAREAERKAAQRSSQVEKALGNVIRSAGTVLGRELTRSIFGNRRR